EIIDLSTLSPEVFLQSDVPFMVMLALLAGEKTVGKRPVIKKILSILHALLADDPALLERKLIQLEILGRLRNVQKIIIEEEQNMRLRMSIKGDIRYQQGLVEGKKEGVEELVKKMLQTSKYTSEEIASLVNLPLKSLERLRKSIEVGK